MYVFYHNYCATIGPRLLLFFWHQFFFYLHQIIVPDLSFLRHHAHSISCTVSSIIAQNSHCKHSLMNQKYHHLIASTILLISGNILKGEYFCLTPAGRQQKCGGEACSPYSAWHDEGSNMFLRGHIQQCVHLLISP